MDTFFLSDRPIILTGSDYALLDIIGPAYVGLEIQTNGKEPTKAADAVPAQTPPATVETDYESSADSKLPASDGDTAGTKKDPNARPAERSIERQNEARRELVNNAAGKELISSAELKSGKEPVQVMASKIDAQTNKAEIEARLEVLVTSGKLGPAEQKFFEELLGALQAKTVLGEGMSDYAALVGTTEAGPSRGHQEYLARRVELTQLVETVEKVVERALPAGVSLKAGLAKARAELKNIFETKIVAKEHAVTDLKARLTNTRLVAAERRQLEGKLAATKDELATLRAEYRRLQQLIKLSVQARGTAEDPRATSLQDLNRLFTLLRQLKTLDGKVVVEEVAVKTGFILSEKEAEELTKTFEGAFELRQEAGGTRQEAGSTRHEAGGTRHETQATSGGLMSAQSAGGAGSDEPIDATPAVKKILGNEPTSDEPQATSDDFEQAVSDWRNLSTGEIAMQIASHSVTMGIQSNFYESKSEEKKLKKQIDKLIAAVAAGNLDAVQTAWLLISQSSKKTLAKIAAFALETMEDADSQMKVLYKDFDANNASPGELQKFSVESQNVSGLRQSAIMALRDVKGLHDEIETGLHSYTSNDYQHSQRISSW